MDVVGPELSEGRVASTTTPDALRAALGPASERSTLWL